MTKIIKLYFVNQDALIYAHILVDKDIATFRIPSCYKQHQDVHLFVLLHLHNECIIAPPASPPLSFHPLPLL